MAAAAPQDDKWLSLAPSSDDDNVGGSDGGGHVADRMDRHAFEHDDDDDDDDDDDGGEGIEGRRGGFSEQAERLMKSMRKLHSEGLKGSSSLLSGNGVDEQRAVFRKFASAGAENPLGAAPDGDDDGRADDGGGTLKESADASIGTLMANLEAPHGGGDASGVAVGMGPLKRQLERLQRAQRAASIATGPASRVKRLRVDRDIKFDAARKDIGKFIPQIAANQKAEQLQLGQAPTMLTNTAAALTSTFTAANDFEKLLASAIAESGVSESNVKAAKALPADTAIRDAQRQKNMTRIRALMFYERQRNKRQAKIKSKVFRKIQRKSEDLEKERLLEWLEEENPDMAASIRQEFEEKRAKLRLLKEQKARQKWAKVATRFGGKSMQRAITDQHQKAHDEKKAIERIAKKKFATDDRSSDDDNHDITDDDDDDGNDADKSVAERLTARGKAALLDEMKKGKETPLAAQKGVLAMKFMRDAIEKQRQQNDLEAKEMLEDMDRLGISAKEARLRARDDYIPDVAEDAIGLYGMDAGDADEMVAKQRDATGMNDSVTGGSGTGGSGTGGSGLVTEEELAAAERDVAALFGVTGSVSTDVEVGCGKRRRNITNNVGGAGGAQRRHEAAIGDGHNNDIENDKKDVAGHVGRRQGAATNTAAGGRKLMPAGVSGDTAGAAVAISSSKKRKCEEQLSKKYENASRVEGSGIGAGSGGPGGMSSGAKKDVEGDRDPHRDDQHPVDDSELGALVPLGDDPELAANREIIREIFVTGNQADEFRRQMEEAEAAEDAAEADDQRGNGQLRGWGHWSGKNGAVNPPKRKRENKIVGHGGRKPQNSLSQGQTKSGDTAGNENGKPKSSKTGVFVSRKLDRKLAKYFVKDAPGTFESSEQYEFGLRQPLGPEWNTSEVHKRLVQPKVVVRTGAIITPLEAAKKMPDLEVDSLLQSWDSRKKKTVSKARL